MCILLSLCWETSFHSCARPKRQTDCTCSFFFSSSIIATNQPSLVSLLFSFSSTSLSFLSSSFSRNKSLYLVIYSYSCRFYFFLLFIINLSHLSLLFCFCSSVLFRRVLLPSLSLFLAFFLTLVSSLFLFFLFLSYFFHQIPLFLSSHRVLSLLLYLQRVPLAPRLSHLVLLTPHSNHYTPAPPFSFHVPQTIQFIRQIIRGVASNPTPPQTRSTFQPPSSLLSSSLPSMNRGMLREERYTFSLFLYMKDLNMADFQLRLLPPAGALQRNCRRSLKRISEKKEEMRKSGIEKSLIFFFYFSNIPCLENINRSRNIKKTNFRKKEDREIFDAIF